MDLYDIFGLWDESFSLIIFIDFEVKQYKKK